MLGRRPRARARRPGAARHRGLTQAFAGLGVLAAAVAGAAGLAFAMVRLIARGLGLRSVGARPGTRDRPALPGRALPDVPRAEPALHLSGGRGVLLGSMAALAVLLLLAAGAEAITLDHRPDDYHQPLPERRQVGTDLLESYRWIDEEAGLVALPIERAMDLLAERGLPSRSNEASRTFRDAGLGGPSDSSGGQWP